MDHKAFIEREVEFALAGRQPGQYLMPFRIKSVYNHPTNGKLVVELESDPNYQRPKRKVKDKQL
jgi:hypothetical protein